MKKIPYFLLVFLMLFSLECQNKKLLLTDEYFMVLYNELAEFRGSKLDIKFFIETKEGVDFLIKKLETEPSIQRQSMVLFILGYSKDKRVVEVLSNYRNSERHYEKSINSLLRIQTAESTKSLEQFLSTLDPKSTGKAQYLINALSLNASLGSIEVLDNFQQKIGSENKLLTSTIETVKHDIQTFNKQLIDLIQRKLCSDERKKVLWVIQLLNLHKDENCLPIIRDYHLRFDEMCLDEEYDNGRIRDLLLLLRGRLGDDIFTPEEKDYLQKRQQLEEDARKRTLKLFRGEKNYYNID